MSETSLELSEKYKKALINSGMGLWELNTLTKRLTWDEGFRILLEKCEGSYEGHIDEEFENVFIDDRENLQNYLKKILADDSEINAHFRILTKKQNIKYIKMNAYRVKHDGKLIALIGISLDVTSESLLQNDVVNSREFTENVLNAIPEPIFVKNAKNEIIYANSEYAKFINKSNEDFIGKKESEVLCERMASVFLENEYEVFKNNISSEKEKTFIDSQGKSTNVVLKKTPLFLGTSEKIIVGVVHDITESKSIQNSLVEQSKMASLGEMASEMAHEVNNPLMIIQGKSQLLQDKISSQPIDLISCQNDLVQIEINCMRIDKLIKSLKSISRKADEDPFEEISLFELIDEAIEICKERFKRKKLNLYVNADAGIDHTFTTRARPSEIVQVVVNLLNNSYDAICNQDRGWVRIYVSLTFDIYSIQITDSGSKIPQEVAKKMMSPFFTTKPTGKGTGLGLSVSKQIIENHTGELYYDPNGNNTRFVFTLPRI